MEEKIAEVSSRGDSIPTPPTFPTGGDGSENLRDEINEDDERSENSADQISRIIETFQGEMRAHIQQRRAKKEKNLRICMNWSRKLSAKLPHFW